MSKLISSPKEICAAGKKPRKIEEYSGRINTNNTNISIARMKSPAGWMEPGQTPLFDEHTIVLDGMLRVETESEVYDVRAGQAFIAYNGKWVRYSTPDLDGAEYIAVCIPAFSPDLVNRNESQFISDI